MPSMDLVKEKEVWHGVAKFCRPEVEDWSVGGKSPQPDPKISHLILILFLQEGKIRPSSKIARHDLTILWTDQSGLQVTERNGLPQVEALMIPERIGSLVVPKNNAFLLNPMLDTRCIPVVMPQTAESSRKVCDMVTLPVFE